jgi:hypothetical protein
VDAACGALKEVGVEVIEQKAVGPAIDQRGAAPELDRLSQEFLQTLRAAGDAVRAELEYFTRAAYLDAASLRRVQGSAAEFAGQATSLAKMMRAGGADDALTAEVATLSHFFRDAEDQIGSLHQAAR